MKKSFLYHLTLLGLLTLSACADSDINEGSAKGQKTLNSALDACAETYKDPSSGGVPRSSVTAYANCRWQAFSLYAVKAYGVYEPIHSDAERADQEAAQQFARGELSHEQFRGAIARNQADMYNLLATRTEQIAEYKQQKANENRQRWANALNSLAHSTGQNNAYGASATSAPLTSPAAPTTYTINRMGNMNTITGTDGSYVTCNSFGNSTQCQRTR